MRAIDPLRARCVGASDLVDVLPSSPARSASWAAYAHDTYAEELLKTCAHDGYVDLETARLVRVSFRLAAACLEIARGGPGEVPAALAHWQSTPRSQDQLAGMRDALESLRTYLAYELGSGDWDLVPIDEALATVARLWIERAPAEIRGALGTALVKALDEAYDLGRRRFG